MSARSLLAAAVVSLLAASAPAQVYYGVPTFSPTAYTPLVRPAAAPVFATTANGYSYTDPYTGVTTTTSQAYNPYTGTTTQYGTTYNPYTGATTQNAVSSNLYSGVTSGTSTTASPYGGTVTRSNVVNRFTGAGYTTARYQPGVGGVFRR